MVTQCELYCFTDFTSPAAGVSGFGLRAPTEIWSRNCPGISVFLLFEHSWMTVVMSADTGFRWKIMIRYACVWVCFNQEFASVAIQIFFTEIPFKFYDWTTLGLLYIRWILPQKSHPQPQPQQQPPPQKQKKCRNANFPLWQSEETNGLGKIFTSSGELVPTKWKVGRRDLTHEPGGGFPVDGRRTVVGRVGTEVPKSSWRECEARLISLVKGENMRKIFTWKE